MTTQAQPKSRFALSAEEDALQREISAFLTYEAQLLDEWRLDEWSQLLADDVRYHVPSLQDPDADHRDTLFLISDDRPSLLSRVGQLLGHTAWVENPRSRTRRLITSVRAKQEANGEISVAANFAVWRFQLEGSDVYVGRYGHRLIRTPRGELLFRERRAMLDMETLRPHGRLSIIL